MMNLNDVFGAGWVFFCSRLSKLVVPHRELYFRAYKHFDVVRPVYFEHTVTLF